MKYITTNSATLGLMTFQKKLCYNEAFNDHFIQSNFGRANCREGFCLLGGTRSKLAFSGRPHLNLTMLRFLRPKVHPTNHRTLNQPKKTHLIQIKNRLVPCLDIALSSH